MTCMSNGRFGDAPWGAADRAGLPPPGGAAQVHGKGGFPFAHGSGRMRLRVSKVALVGLVLVSASSLSAQDPPPPVIDVHFHALRATDQGPPPLGMCLPVEGWPPVETGAEWLQTFVAFQKAPNCSDPIWSPESDVELMERSLEVAERRNVIGITSGPRVEEWLEAAPDRIIPGILFNGAPGSPSLDSLRAMFVDGRVQVFGEVTIQYHGGEPGDATFEPYLSLAEELDVPVGIHIGTGPPGAPYFGFSRVPRATPQPVDPGRCADPTSQHASLRHAFRLANAG